MWRNSLTDFDAIWYTFWNLLPFIKKAQKMPNVHFKHSTQTYYTYIKCLKLNHPYSELYIHRLTVCKGSKIVAHNIQDVGKQITWKKSRNTDRRHCTTENILKIEMITKSKHVVWNFSYFYCRVRKSICSDFVEDVTTAIVVQ